MLKFKDSFSSCLVFVRAKVSSKSVNALSIDFKFPLFPHLGGFYGGASALKLRLLPLLGQGFFSSGISTDTSLGVLEDVSRKHREFSDLQSAYDVSLDRLERDLTVRPYCCLHCYTARYTVVYIALWNVYHGLGATSIVLLADQAS